MPPPGVWKVCGRGSMTDPQMFLQQDYQQLKQYFLIRRARIIDDMFPPDHNSIGQGLLNPNDLARVVWKRPRELVANPKFIVDGVSRFDFGQGRIGNCWFLASIGALTFQEKIFHQVVPQEQSFDEEYCGLFHFRFWRFGKWVDVIIDDKLPTLDGRLIFVYSNTPNEFWPALLEKAYAKVCGSYADMESGTPKEALVDFTGGIHMHLELKDAPPDLFALIQRAAKYGSLMGCGTPQGRSGSDNRVSFVGLVDGHAYAVTGIEQVMSRRNLVDLVRLWNPWGHQEWRGEWSDLSPLWQTVNPQDRERCLSRRHDGEFWMTLEDFCKTFEDLDICCLCPEFIDGHPSCHWRPSSYDGRWVAGINAGGCMNYPDSFWTNPQFRIKVDSLQGECEEKQGDSSNMLVSLMQKPDRRNRRLVKNLHIGFSLFEVTKEYKEKRGKFPASFFSTRWPVAKSKNYTDAREVMELFRLEPGEYLIVPTTYEPNKTASFMLSILSKAETHVFENSDEFDDIQVENVATLSNMPRENYDVVDGFGDEKKPQEEYDDVDGFGDENKQVLLRQYSDQYEEVDAEKLQQVLNSEILQGDLKGDGFSLDACRSMLALMDTSSTGKLNSDEFVHLWRKVTTYKAIFFKTDVSHKGTLLLSELRNAIMAAGVTVSDDMLNLMALRYGASSGHMTLDRFIGLVLRLDCMSKIFRQFSDGTNMVLRDSEWMYISMYT